MTHSKALSKILLSISKPALKTYEASRLFATSLEHSGSSGAPSNSPLDHLRPRTSATKVPSARPKGATRRVSNPPFSKTPEEAANVPDFFF